METKSFQRIKMKIIFMIFIVVLAFHALNVKAALTSEPDNYEFIESKTLKLTIDKSFPTIIQYQWLESGEIFFGQEEKLTQVKINDQLYSPLVSFSKSKNIAFYKLYFAPIEVIINIQIKVINNTVELNIVGINENADFKVSTIEIPNHSLLSVRNTQTGAAFAGSQMYMAIKGSGDSFISINEKMAIDSASIGYLYGILNTDKLAASIWTNAVGEKNDKGRIQKQTVQKDGYYKTALWSGSWIYRAQKMNLTDPLPSVKIVITKDQNNDKLIDWQDGAIAFRSIMNNPMGTEIIPNLVVQRIPMNFASQATNPFTKTLDETKRIYLNTDGLGQFVILKGYGSEGHDSKHPDYGDIGKRQGGAADMEMLCKSAQKYNAFMGVHINGTESYPEASAFNDTLVNKTKPGWDWLDASYYIDKRYDAVSNNRNRRLQSLKNQVPSLNFIYCDVWYAGGSWDSRKLGREIHDLGWVLATEFPSDHEYDAVWNHWAVDYNYGGVDLKGYSSKIARFIRNHQKDTWVGRHQLLGGEEMFDFEGWQGRNNIDSCIKMTFNTCLPTKYLQHFPILKWDENNIEFEKNISVKMLDGTRIISKDGIVVLNGNTYLLPCKNGKDEKLYHWNSESGKSDWELIDGWENLKSVKLYKLTDQGRKFVRDISVLNGHISIDAEAYTPYVIYKKEAIPNPEMNWGEGTYIKDPGFNSGSLKYWNTEGNGASVIRNYRGQYELLINGKEKATVSQTITGLIPGNYYASVYVSTSDNRKAYLGVNNYGGKEVSNYANNSLWKNYIAADSKSDTNMQRMYIFFDVSEGQSNTNLYLSAEAGSAPVHFDDIRIAAIRKTIKPDSIYFAEDFENIPDGLYPFVKGPAGGVNDPRVHLSELHYPYTQRGWNEKPIDDVFSGQWSLKAHAEEMGLLLQTIPQTIRFSAGKTYTVSFYYEASGSDYALVIGEGTDKKMLFTLNQSHKPSKARFTFIAGESGNSWIGIEKLNAEETDLVLDDLIVIENKN